MAATALESVLRRDRLIVASSLFVLALLAWFYLFHLAAGMAAIGQPAGGSASMPGMADMPGMESAPGSGGMAAMPGMAPTAETAAGTLAAFAFLAAMWIVMMVGMMLPSAAATILLFAALERRQQGRGPLGRTALFVAGYFLVWSAFSLIAAAAQTALSRLGMLSAEMAVTSALLGGAVFVLAGLYEFTPFKDRCLAHCRSPLDWIARHRRPGDLGALKMGIAHGAYCVGCCFVLMLLLFAGGVMNLLWVAAIAGVVLVEKLLPGGKIVARSAGVVLIAAGIAVGAGAF